MATYSMTPIANNTRFRTDHNTFSIQVAGAPSFNADEILSGAELWEAPADGAEVRKGDKWLRVTHKNGVALPQSGWTAYIHKGIPICNNYQEILDDPEPEDPPATSFPASFVLEEPSGARAEYVFVRVIE